MIGIIGGGQMGAGIAELVATHGYDAVVIEASAETVHSARERIQRSLRRAVERGKCSDDSAAAALERIRIETDWAAIGKAEFVIEAVPENLTLKTEVFRRLDAVVGPETVLGSNTSSLPIARIAAASARPAQVIGMHFFNPVPVMQLVEVIAGRVTSEATIDRTLALAAALDRRVVRSQDRAGFIVNGLLMPYLMSAVRMLESGLATAEDIDAGMVLGCAHPMGPLALADFIGLDTCASIADALCEEYREAHFAPPPLLRRMVESGQLGRKTGQGFYTY